MVTTLVAVVSIIAFRFRSRAASRVRLPGYITINALIGFPELRSLDGYCVEPPLGLRIERETLHGPEATFGTFMVCKRSECESRLP